MLWKRERAKQTVCKQGFQNSLSILPKAYSYFGEGLGVRQEFIK